MEYIHYGHKSFDRNKFDSIKNRPELPKPFGGIWACRTDADLSWKNWCEDTEFGANLKDNFIFTLSKNARILVISDSKDLEKLPTIGTYTREIYCCLDFEKLAEEYDAIEIYAGSNRDLYFKFYGWDCDSILIMNPDIIEIGKKIEKSQEELEEEIDM